MSHSLTIRRWNNRILLPADTSAGEATRQRIDLLCRTTLTNALRARLSTLLSAADDSVWFIRRLELDLACSLTHDDHLLADAWSELTLRALRQAMSRGGSGDHEVAVWFASREDYLASFLSDLIGGTARGLWYYANFESLFALPDSMIVVETLRKFPQQADAVLTRLVRMDRWNAIVSKLSDSQCGHLLRILHSDSETGPVCTERLLEAWQSCGRPVSGTSTDILRLYVAARASGAGSAISLGAVAPALLHFLAAPSRVSSGTFALHTPEFMRLVELLGARQARQLVTGLAELTDSADSAVPTPREAILTSSLAGLFYVWSALLASELSASLLPAKQLRFLLALRLAGHARQRTGMLDPVPLLLAELEDAPTVEQLESLQLPASQLMQIQTLLLQTQFRRRWLGGQLSLHALHLPLCKRRIWLVRDLHTGTWVFAADGDRAAHQVLNELRVIWPDPSPLLVLVDQADPLVDLADSILGVSIRSVEQLPDAERSVAQQQLAKQRPLTADLEFLSTHLRLDLPIELLLLLLGRFALQAFASRLPGFAHSSLGWLSKNFLETTGTLTRHDDGLIDVSVVPPPLHVVLRLGGWETDAFRLHGGCDVRLRLLTFSERSPS